MEMAKRVVANHTVFITITWESYQQHPYLG
jgi:hypothetical protein